MPKFIHVVAYNGNSVWQDKENKMWSRYENPPMILRVRRYEDDLDGEEFLKEHDDLAFMMKYGELTIETIGTVVEPPKEPPKVVEPIVEPAQEPAQEPSNDPEPVQEPAQEAEQPKVAIRGRK